MTTPGRSSPYQGLTPFNEDDASFFFGRDRESRLIAADLFAAPLTVLYGGSGVGKSSILRAGVVPLLRLRKDVAAVLFSAWQNDPLSDLKNAVLSVIQTTESDSKGATSSGGALAELAEESLPNFLRLAASRTGCRLMIILDQFEEYFLYRPQDDDFGREFTAAATLGDISVSFLLSMREEALARLDRFEGRIPTLFEKLRRIDHLDAAAGRAAIEGPLTRYNDQLTGGMAMGMESTLIDIVLDEVRTGRVQVGDRGRGTTADTFRDAARIEAPYLQLVMTRLWNEEQRNGSSTLQVATFQRLGQAERIVQSHLDEVMARLTPSQRDAAADVFQLLVTPSGTKIAHSVRDLALTAGVDGVQLGQILAALASGSDRILRHVAVLPERPDDPRYEIFHDRLAGAVLDWRARHLQQRAAKELRSKEARRRQLPVVGVEPVATSETSWASPIAPPFGVIAAMFRNGPTASEGAWEAPTVVLGEGVATSYRPVGRWKPGAPFAPTTAELAEHLGQMASMDLSGLRSINLAEVASYVVSATERVWLNEELSQLFADAVEPTPAHSLIARIATSTPMLVISTTFDTLIEKAFQERDISYHLVVNSSHPEHFGSVLWKPPGEDFKVVPANQLSLGPRTSCIYKVFGSVMPNSGASSTILTEEEEVTLFARIMYGALMPVGLVPKLRKSRTLILGVSLQSGVHRMLVNSLIQRPEGDRRYKGWAVERNVSQLNRTRWRTAGIDVYDQEVRTFVESLEKWM